MNKKIIIFGAGKIGRAFIGQLFSLAGYELVFVDAIPGIQGIAPKKNIKAWVDRKLFIHNLGHAIAAYFGNYLHPECQYVRSPLR